MTVRVKRLQGVDWKKLVTATEGSFVLCVRSNEYSYYKPGEVMQVRENEYKNLSLFHVTREDDDRAFGGDFGAWEPYYVKQSLEELL